MKNLCKLFFGGILSAKCYNIPLKQYGLITRRYSVRNDVLNIKLNNVMCHFPVVWLRDNCQCAHCFHQDSQSRIIDWKNFDINVQIEFVKDNTDMDNIFIKWMDGHTSTFRKDWLSKRQFLKANQDEYLETTYRQERHTWNKNNFYSILEKYEYKSIMNENECLKKWLQTLRCFGVAIITNVPEVEDAGTKVANRVQFVKETHYGKRFSVKAKPGTTNVAYLPSNLQMHTDLPYYEYKPGVNLLHCITQARGNGGENLLSDGLHIAEHLKCHHPHSYALLSNIMVDWEDIGREGNNKFHSIYRSPVICETLDGDIVRINHSVPQRSSHFNVPVDKVRTWYDAMKLFVNMIHDTAVTYKMAPGEILCFDNLRLLHGRREYNDTPDNTRHIIGVYLDWDYIHSRIRVLSK